jgi:hypothetical protein
VLRENVTMTSLNSPSPRMVTACAMAAALLLAGCSGKKNEPVPAESDAAVNGALGDQIVVDPSLSAHDGAAPEAGGGKVALSPQQRSPEAIQAARDEAMVQAGGNLKSAPLAQSGSVSSLTQSAASAAQVAPSTKAASADCTKKVQYAAAWAGKLPRDLPIYPRAVVQEAAGTDSDGCRLRVVTFASPVPPKDVIDFYYTKAMEAGYGAEYRMDGTDHVLGGRKGGQAYVVYVRKLGSGLTEVDLVASGS